MALMGSYWTNKR